MQIPVPLRRTAYRLAYALFRVYRFLLRPRVRGVKCVLTDGGRVLLVRHTYGPDEWDLPGGGMHRSERPLQTARREMQEELGLTIDSWRSLGDFFGHLRYEHDVLHCFQAAVDGEEIVVDPGEIERVAWFSDRALPPNLGRYVLRILARADVSTRN